MSNFLAIATVTATLSQLLQAAANEAVPGATVSTVRPESMDNGAPGPGINIYLYQIIPNAAWRNADLPTRRADGTLVQRPQAALDLHYLLTFYGNETELEPQRLLGSGVSVLHAQPVLTREMIRAAISAVTGGDSDHYLADSDLAEQVETIKFSPLPLNLEELSKLWSVFFQTPYALSVAYQASVVLIEAEGTPQRALPVREPLVYGVPFRQPVIEQVLSQAGANQPIVADGTLVIRGQRLRGDVTQVRIGEVEVTPASENVSDTQISLLLSSPPFPAGSLRAGVQGVQVVHPMMMGEPLTLHRGVESNVAAFVLRPTITGVSVSDVQGSGDEPRSADVTVQVNPTVGKAQRVVLLLNERSNEAPAAYSFAAPSREADADSITIPISGVKAAEYLVRMQVDGAESPLAVDTDPASPTFNQYVGPTVPIGICLTNCLRATVTLSTTEHRVNGDVTVEDENGNPVEGATVSVTWELPNAQTRERSGDTDQNGVARFWVPKSPGTYRLTVTNITKADYTFDPDNSILSESITVP